MCRAFSFYAARVNGEVKLWWSERSDSHSEIASEHKLRDTGLIPLYAGEFYPDDSAPSPDLSTWTLSWDSEATNASRDNPSDEDAAAFRLAVERIVPRWIQTDPAAEQVVTTRGWAWAGQQTVNGGVGWAHGNATQTVNGGYGWAHGNATQTVNGGEGSAHDNATQTDNRKRAAGE